MTVRKYEIDMSQGSILKNIMLFALPLMLSNILQLLYNAADIVVVGRWAGSEALSAVGATSTLTGLLTNLFIGLSVGASVAVSKRYGAGDMYGLRKVAHTSVALSIVAGIVAMCIGMFLCRPLLSLMGTPSDIIDFALLYMRIIFLGVPASLVYNFGAAVLRAVGDTRRPLYILVVTGIVNVVLNLILVIGFHLSVVGVAVATVVANYLSAIAVMYSLMYSDAPYKIDLRELKIKKEEVKDMMSVGLPAGIQSSVFALGNTVVQSAVNSFGVAAIAANTASGSIEGFVYAAMNAFCQAAMISVGQNYGAKNEKRIYKSIKTSIICTSVAGIVLGWISVIFARPLLGIYIVDSPAAMEIGIMRTTMMGGLCFLCGIMEVMSSVLRGLGYSRTPAICSLLGACGFRLLWVFAILPFKRQIWFLYLCWPISWIVVIIMHTITFMLIRKKSMQEMYGV